MPLTLYIFNFAIFKKHFFILFKYISLKLSLSLRKKIKKQNFVNLVLSFKNKIIAIF